MTTEEAGGYAAAAITAIAGFAGGFRAVWGRKRKDRLTESLARIEAQFATNGGSSIKDDLAAIRRELTCNREQIAAMRAEIGAVRRHMATSQALTRMVLNFEDRVTWECGPDGALTFISSAIQRWVGRVPGDLLGENWRNMIHPADRQRVIEEWEEAVEQKRQTEMNYNLMDEKRNKFPVFSRGFTAFGDDGQFVGWVGVMTREAE